MKSFLPTSYIAYACEGPIEEGIYYYFKFIVKSVQKYDDRKILIHGIKIFDQKESKHTLMHSKKLRYLFINAKDKTLDLIGKLYEPVVFFPSFGKLDKNRIKPVVKTKLTNVPKELTPYLEKIYNPRSIEEVNEALRQLFTYEISAIKSTIKPQHRQPYKKNATYSLPFSLSVEQTRVVNHIWDMFEGTYRMCTLVHGDVGCGKTVIGYIASLKVVANGFKVLILTPNILLTHQTYKVFQKFNPPCKVSLYMSTHKDLTGDIIVGTQALLHIEIPEVGLVVIDEQHKFGILQRQKFQTDILMLSATPIPRTHYLANLGNIKQLKLSHRSSSLVPYIVHSSKREKVIEKLVNVSKERIVWVCKTISYAEEMFNYIKAKGGQVNIIHGRMKEKDTILEEFANSYGILVSTTVMEVGVDIDIHTIVIDNAEQFGLAQLHQLKGRAGRHSKGKCIMIGELEKLQLIKENPSGHEVTQLDLELRGAGSIHQTNQSGKSFLFNKLVCAYKLVDHVYQVDPIPVSQEVIDFFMQSKDIV